MMDNKVIVSGLGVISALGVGVNENLDSLMTLKSGIGPITLFQTNHDVMVGEVRLGNMEMIEMLCLDSSKRYSRTALLGLIAAREAYSDSGFLFLGQQERMRLKIGVISSTSVGGMDVSENFYREYRLDKSKGRLRDLIGHDCGSSTKIIADYLKADDFVSTVSTACSSASNAIMLGTRMIKNGLLDVAVVGGTDSLSRFTVNGFYSLGILDKEQCRPFDETRAGLNIGEGAGYLIIQRSDIPHEKTYGEVCGYANANDAYHQTASSSDGTGAYLAMSGALEVSGLSPDDISIVHAHGTGTPNNDASEGSALLRIFGNNVPLFSSTKSYTGHTLAAVGGVESVFSLLSLKYGYVWPNLNFRVRMKDVDVMPVVELVSGMDLKYVLKNSFGFGGNCTTLIFGYCNR